MWPERTQNTNGGRSKKIFIGNVLVIIQVTKCETVATFTAAISDGEDAKCTGWSGMNEEYRSMHLSVVPRDSRQKGLQAGVAQGRDLSVGSAARENEGRTKERRGRPRGGGRKKEAALEGMLRGK